jgi:hypothetical protein
VKPDLKVNPMSEKEAYDDFTSAFEDEFLAIQPREYSNRVRCNSGWLEG